MEDYRGPALPPTEAPPEIDSVEEATSATEEEIEDTFEDVPEETGDQLLDDLLQFVVRYVALPTVVDAWVVTLWIAHTWFVHVLDSTPRLIIQSPTKRAGKTRLLEVIQALSRGGIQMVHATVAAMIRMIDYGGITVLLDEVDTIFGAGGTSKELLAIVNAGYRRGATVPRCVGDSKDGISVEQLNAFGPIALAGIDNYPWPDTVMDRGIVVRIERRREEDVIEPWRRSLVQAEVDSLCRRLGAFVYRYELRLPPNPPLPAGVFDRDADVWEPVVALAHLAGGDWPSHVEQAAVEYLAKREDDGDNVSLPELLLQDIAGIFERTGLDRISSAELVTELVAIEESPWGNLRGDALNPRSLAFRLRQYKIRSKDLRIDMRIVKGYERSAFHDAFNRYLPHGSVPSFVGGHAAVVAALVDRRIAPVPPPEPLELAGVVIPTGTTRPRAEWLLRDAGAEVATGLTSDEQEALRGLPSGPPVFLGVELIEGVSTENDIHEAMERQELEIKDLHPADFAAMREMFPGPDQDAEEDF